MNKIVCYLFTLLILFVSPFLYAEKIDIYTEHYPPYNLKSGDTLNGMSVEVLDAMLKQMGSNQTIQDVKLTNWSRAYSIAQKKKNAMVFSTTRTESREKLFKWVGPIVNTTVGVIALKENKIVIKDVFDLNKYKIGAVLKDVGELLLLDLGVNPEQIQYVKGEEAINLSFTKMKNNRIDLFSYNINVAFSNARLEGFNTNEYEVVYTLAKSALYFAFNKDTDDTVISQWQDAFDAIKANGTYDNIMLKY
jgi:polar amino acid transport system substrate-binding protein